MASGSSSRNNLSAWRDRTIYFILIDRFCNGDKGNDDFGQGEFDPRNDDCFQGGDLKGIIARLPHIKRLGFSAIWITPPVHNQWTNPYIGTRGYHGYWARDFTKIDPHFGTLEDYKALVREAHKLGLKVIQDIVVNHTGNFFTVDPQLYDRQHPERGWKDLGDGAPNDPVFAMNNPNFPEHRKAAVYNFTPNISDFKSRRQTLTYAMGDLDDINLKSPLAARRMREIYRYWIEEAGVDGFRVDTVYYTPEEFYEDFLHKKDAKDPGVKVFARRRGIKDFFSFAEVWSYDYGAVNRYLSGRRLDSAIDHPLNEALGQVFYRKAATDVLRAPLQAKRINPELWVNFLDNHDVERVSSRAAWPPVRQSLVALYTLPGIPCVYYGTEAGLTRPRQNMFDEALLSEDSERSRLLAKLARFRAERPALRGGRCRVESCSPRCGILAYSMTQGKESHLVVFNTAPDRMVFKLDRRRRRFTTQLASDVSLENLADVLILPPDSFLVLRRDAKAIPARAEPPAVELSAPKRSKTLIDLRWRLNSEVAELSVVCDGDYDRRIALADVGAGRARLQSSRLDNGRHSLALLAKTPSGELALSKPWPVKVENPYRSLAAVDGTPSEKLLAPAEPSYDGQSRLQRLEVLSSGRDVRLKLTMGKVTSDWNPPNGYDHVYFNVFFELPGRPGSSFLPRLRCTRDDFRFSLGFQLHGWGARSFSASDSTPEAYGAPLIGDVEQKADAAANTVIFTFSSRFFDGLDGLSGVKVFVGTWDGYLGEPREIASAKDDWKFYTVDGSPAAGLPMIYDHAMVRIP